MLRTGHALLQSRQQIPSPDQFAPRHEEAAALAAGPRQCQTSLLGVATGLLGEGEAAGARQTGGRSELHRELQ
eukprot:CAMPEP_0177275082 /NCGR_PEP_ID=MMETSP0367-20130122/67522_1 /TAXON_ID=447022 ORGANISM="Scrippsiella hangoei-like, Strain SHHI-4" /NCGR_SAMPLE_ID=MMETSP0367 /ASSEMBLY_ACC=CAM_ASM_000362 /LENGTH=72 /DNA_ID=CAMNT_0018731483 /DNA_START=265 /DNA_END=480 /DNA_ORIENTATION=+